MITAKDIKEWYNAQVSGLAAELLPCPFCGSKAVTYPSPDDADRNIISCRLGHAPMRTVEGWNTRADPNKAKIEKLEAVLKQARTLISTLLTHLTE